MTTNEKQKNQENNLENQENLESIENDEQKTSPEEADESQQVQDDAPADLPEDLQDGAEKVVADQGEQAAEQINELTSRLLRLQADFDNFRRRTRLEKEDFLKYANQELIAALLPVLDNFQRAIAANNKEEDPFVTGVKMIYKQIMELLGKEGLTPIEAIGSEFDPKLHEAVMTTDSAEHGPNTIVEEFQQGYQFKERVIRPSMVKVANTK